MIQPANPEILGFKIGDSTGEHGDQVIVGYETKSRLPGFDWTTHPVIWNESDETWKMLHPTNKRDWIELPKDCLIQPATKTDSEDASRFLNVSTWRQKAQESGLNPDCHVFEAKVNTYKDSGIAVSEELFRTLLNSNQSGAIHGNRI